MKSFQLCWGSSWSEESFWSWGAFSTWDSPLLCEGKTQELPCMSARLQVWASVHWPQLCVPPRLRSCTWTCAPPWTLRGTETAAHARCPPTAPGNRPTRCCWTLCVSHLLSNLPTLHSSSIPKVTLLVMFTPQKEMTSYSPYGSR